MIPIRTYRSFWQSIKERIPQVGRILFVRTEDELAKQIKEVADNELVLISVIPSADTLAPDHDNVRELEQGLVYSLIKVNRNNMDDEDMVAAQEKTQNVIARIKKLIIEDAGTEENEHHLLCRDMNLNKMHTDPEYNFLGCDGYSLTLQFNTPGF